MCVCVCVTSVIIKQPMLPPCVVDGCYRFFIFVIIYMLALLLFICLFLFLYFEVVFNSCAGFSIVLMLRAKVQVQTIPTAYDSSFLTCQQQSGAETCIRHVR